MKCILFLLVIPFIGMSQPNCYVYLMNKDTLQYNACLCSEKVEGYQYTRHYQEKFDECLEICPYYSFAYQAKSTAYLKSGDFITWKKLIDLAVKYDTLAAMAYRGWCRYQFFRDYKGAIEDIEYLENRLKSINIGYSAGGEYHLITTKALCYSALGNKQKAIEILEDLFKNKKYIIGEFDYYQLGVTYFQINQWDKAMEYFNKQSTTNELAENKYYKALIYKKKGDLINYELEKADAIKRYEKGNMLKDPYTEHMNKVYLEEIKQL